MASRRVIRWICASLAILTFMSQESQAGDLVDLTGWAPEGMIVRGSGLNSDVFQLVAEVEWARSAPRDPSLYQVRVAFPDGRVDTRSFPVDWPPGRRRFPVYVLAAPLRDTVPSGVKVAVSVVDASTGAPVSNTLTAGIDQFPRPRGDSTGNDPGPFGWGASLEGPSRILPNAGPDGLRFARIPGSSDSPGFFLATTESTIAQLTSRIKGYDPKLGRSDEFVLEDPSQPAINLTPNQAMEYLKALSQADLSGIVYRLPTVEQWTRAAKGGKSSNFWWGDDPTFPEGTNLLGPEPALPTDTTAPSTPKDTSPTFKTNPMGLAHTFGNVAEWASIPSGGFARMGGHFRTEPASPLPEVKVEKPDELGPDPFVGVRAAFNLDSKTANALILKKLATDARLQGVNATYDPDKATVTLTGSVSDASTRRAADQLLEGIWFIASVENLLTTASLGPNQLAVLGGQAGAARRIGVLDRTFVEVPLSIRWLDPLPVNGTAWWVNVYLPSGGHVSHKLDPGEPGRSSKLIARIDRSKLAAYGLADDSPVKVALSLGSAVETPLDSRIVSNVLDVRPTFAPKTR